MAIGQRFIMSGEGALSDEEERKLRRKPSGKIFGTKETRAKSPLGKLLGGKSKDMTAGDKAGAGLNIMKAGSAAEGAMAGSALGPIGIAGGAALGLAKGLAAQAKKKRELKAQSIREQGANIKETAKEKNAALKSIMDGLKAAFLGI